MSSDSDFDEEEMAPPSVPGPAQIAFRVATAPYFRLGPPPRGSTEVPFPLRNRIFWAKAYLAAFLIFAFSARAIVYTTSDGSNTEKVCNVDCIANRCIIGFGILMAIAFLTPMLVLIIIAIKLFWRHMIVWGIFIAVAMCMVFSVFYLFGALIL